MRFSVGALAADEGEKEKSRIRRKMEDGETNEADEDVQWSKDVGEELKLTQGD